ncbi:MAG: SseB family protein [Rhodobacteraceae bacterium]|nr:SseB family protein [Paracoccaceae bacterium]
MTETPLDTAHAAMQTGGDAERLRFFERLADAELLLLLAEEPKGDRIEPEIFETGEGRFVLGFDREERLAEFVGHTAPYAGLSGRGLARMLAGQDIGLGLNLDVAPSQFLIPAEAIAWLNRTLAIRPTVVDERPLELAAPAGLPEPLVTALDVKLAAMAGLARMACLVSVTYAPARRGHLLGFIGATPGTEGALASAVGEALTFSGLEAGELDVGFFDAKDEMAARLVGVGLRFDLPEPDTADPPAAPGMDKTRPPKLR